MSTLQLSLVAGNQQVTANLSWQGSQPSGVIDYIILYYASGSGQIHSMSTQSLQVVISNLINDTVFNFYAVAYLASNTNGQRLSETAVQQAIPASSPTVPSGLQAQVSVNGNVISQQVILSWNASSSDSHYPVLNYNVYQSQDNVNFTMIAQPNSPNFTVTAALENGVTYYYKISAVNQIGESAKCASVSAYPSGLATPPQGLLVNYDPDASNSPQAGYQSVDLVWNVPLSNGGNAISGYVIEYSLDQGFASGVTTVNQASTDLSGNIQNSALLVPFADLQTSTGWYFFRVCAVTALGNGQFCEPATIMPTANPDAVQNLTASNLNENGDHQAGCATLSWQYQVNNSCPLFGYLITYLDHLGDPQSIYVYEPDRSPSYTVTDLQNGHDYVFNVMAFNSLGIGESTDVAIMPSTIPDAPDAQIDGHGDGAISFSWNLPENEGSAVTGFNIYRSTDNVHYIQIDSVSALTTSYNDSNLTDGTTYYYKIAGVNANGEGILSNAISEYPSTVPSAVQNITVQPSNALANGQQLAIYWDAPADNGGGSNQ